MLQDMDGPGPARCEMRIDDSGIPILKFIGELDLASVDPVRAAVDAFVRDNPKRVTLDLSDLQFLDSSGLTLFLSLANRIAEVELRDPQPMIRKLLGLTGLSEVFRITP